MDYSLILQLIQLLNMEPKFIFYCLLNVLNATQLLNKYSATDYMPGTESRVFYYSHFLKIWEILDIVLIKM